MGPMVPSFFEEFHMYNQVMAPKALGGWDLYLKGELKELISSCPLPTIWLANMMMLGKHTREDLRIFSKMSRNPARRGVKDLLDFERLMQDELETQPLIYKLKTWSQLSAEFPVQKENNRFKNIVFEEEGWIPLYEFTKRAFRGTLFQELMMSEDIEEFPDRKLRSTYKYIWDYMESKGNNVYQDDLSDWTEDELELVLTKEDPPFYINVKEVYYMNVGPKPDILNKHTDITVFLASLWPVKSDLYDSDYESSVEDHEDEDEDFKEVKSTILEAFSWNLPSLVIGRKFLGL